MNSDQLRDEKELDLQLAKQDRLLNNKKSVSLQIEDTIQRNINFLLSKQKELLSQVNESKEEVRFIYEDITHFGETIKSFTSVPETIKWSLGKYNSLDIDKDGNIYVLTDCVKVYRPDGSVGEQRIFIDFFSV